MKLKVLFSSIFVISVIVFSIHFLYVGKAVYGDGRYYYSYLPALFINHSINFSPVYPHLDIPTWTFTPLGLPANKYSLGPALFWAIPYILSFSITSILGFRNAYATLFQIPVGIWTIGLNVLGLYFLWKSLQKFFSISSATLTTITIFFSTNLFFYGAVDILNSHSITFFLASLLVYLWVNKPTKTLAIIQGVVIGLLMMTRLQEAMFFILPFATWLFNKQKVITLTIIFAFLTFTPQLLVWHSLWGTWLQSPYLQHETFDFFHPHVIEVLFGLESGLFLWTPITLFAFVGLVLFAKRNLEIGIPFLSVFLLELYIIASWSTWWQGTSFSGRMFVSSLPFLAFGMAYLFEREILKKWRYVIAFVVTLINFSLIVLFLLQR